MKKITLFIASFVAVLSFALVPASAGAVSVLPQCSDGTASSSVGADNYSAVCASKKDSVGDIFKTVVDILLYIIGAIAVIMLIVGGLRYVTSAGNASNVKVAKDTIMYALIGLVIAVLAYAIVHFVITGITTGKPS